MSLRRDAEDLVMAVLVGLVLVGESVGGRSVLLLGSGLGSGITGGISERLDALSDALEGSFAKVKDKVAASTDYMDNFRDEITELYAKYRIIKERMTPKPIKNFYDWYRNRTILGNPTMASEMFKSSLDEMKERAQRLSKRNK